MRVGAGRASSSFDDKLFRIGFLQELARHGVEAGSAEHIEGRTVAIMARSAASSIPTPMPAQAHTD